MGFGTLGLVGTAASGNLPPGLFSDASMYMDFLGGIYIGNLISDLSIARTTTGTVGSYVQNSASSVSLFADATRRLTALGLLMEEARVNVVLWNRDLTNAAWTAVNVTTAQDQTGPDGVANSATSLLATGANGTVLQAITLANSARWQTTWVKRITGTGTINMTMDNGGTWTAITVAAGWTRVAIPTQTITNPTVGFQIVTNADKIAVWGVQNENSGFMATSTIPTTTVAVTRSRDIPTLANTPTFGPAFSFYGQGTSNIGSGTGSSPVICAISTGSDTNDAFNFMNRISGAIEDQLLVGAVTKYNGTVLATNNIAVSVKTAGALADADQRHCAGGTLGTARTITPIYTPTTIHIGCRADTLQQWNGYVEKIAVWGTKRIPNATMQSITT